MAKQKYSITSINHLDYKHLRQICALVSIPEYNVRKGDFGGYIASYDCLSQDDECWVDKEACVFEGSQVKDSAYISGHAEIRDFCIIQQNAMVLDYAIVAGYSHLCDFALVKDSAFVYDSFVSNFSRITKNAKVLDRAVVKGFSSVTDNAIIKGDILIHGHSIVNSSCLIKHKHDIVQHKSFTMFYDIYGELVLNKHFEEETLDQTEVESAKNSLNKPTS